MSSKKKIGKIHEGNISLEHHPTSWLSQAHEFKRTEELIYLDILRDYDITSIQRKTKVFAPRIGTASKVHLLVIGYAIENLLKCIYLNRHPEIIKDGVIKDNLFKRHDLVQIAIQGLNLKLNEEERFLLDISTKSIIWFGKYPIPLKETDTFAILETNRSRLHEEFHLFFTKLVSLASIKMPIVASTDPQFL